MITLIPDLHPHTTFSHGKGSPEQNISAAIKRGLKQVGISDHSVRHLFYGIRDINRYYDELMQLKENYSSMIDVKAGIELNIISDKGDFDMPDRYLDMFDFVILGFHKGAAPKDFASLFDMFIGRNIKRLSDRHLKAFDMALASGKIDILAHPGYAISSDRFELAKICEKHGVVYEINNKHKELTSEEITRISNGTGVNFLISTDAHVPGDVGLPLHALEIAEKASLDPKRIINSDVFSND